MVRVVKIVLYLLVNFNFLGISNGKHQTEAIKNHSNRYTEDSKDSKYRDNNSDIDTENHDIIDHLSRRHRYQGRVLDGEEKAKVQGRMIEKFIKESKPVLQSENVKYEELFVKPRFGSYTDGRWREGTKVKVKDKSFGVLNDDNTVVQCAQREWTEWTAWTACSANCGQAVRFQLRHCVFLHGLGGKTDCAFRSFRNCKGQDMNNAACHGLPPCTEISYWGQWTECSAVCKGRTGSRQRMRINESSRGTITHVPELTQIEACQGWRSDCTGWSQWSSCSESCANKVGIRERMLVVKTPEGFYRRDFGRLQMEPCVGQRVLCEEWTSWGPWSSCNCVMGRQIRERRCERKLVMVVSISIVVDDSLCRGHSHMTLRCSPAPESCPGRRRQKSRNRPKSTVWRHRTKTLRRKVPQCVTGCDGVPRGRYPSCRGCFHYWQCYKRRQKERMCAKRRRWDNQVKKCLPWSSTCPGF